MEHIRIIGKRGVIIIPLKEYNKGLDRENEGFIGDILTEKDYLINRIKPKKEQIGKVKGKGEIVINIKDSDDESIKELKKAITKLNWKFKTKWGYLKIF